MLQLMVGVFATNAFATISVPVNCWGRTLKAHTAATDSTARFGESAIPLGTVS